MDPQLGPMNPNTESEKYTFYNAHNKQHPCVTCGKAYVSLSLLNRHLQTHLPDDPQNCTTCGKSCRNGLKLKEHVRRHGWEGTYKCGHCAKNCKTNQYLKRHIKTVHGVEGRKYTRSKNHVCSTCGLKLGTPTELTIHLRTHTGEKPFKCSTCPKAFANKTTLRGHLRVHTGEKPEECLFCGRRFAWKSALNSHIRTYSAQNPYKCIGDSTTLKRHCLAIHPKEQQEEDGQTPTHMQMYDEDPLRIPSENKQGHLSDDINVQCPDNLHVCPLCDKVCPGLYKLTRHMRSHTGERNFKCSADGCGKEFMQRNTLESHLRTHTGEKMEPRPRGKLHNLKYHNPQTEKHSCVSCGKVFISSSDLRRHLETHLHVDPQECPIGRESCRNSVVLKNHMKKHSLQGNYDCGICLKNFTTKIAFQAHIKSLHGERKYNRNIPSENNQGADNNCSAKLDLQVGRTEDNPESQDSKISVALHPPQMRAGSKARPFLCPQCPKTYRLKKYLNEHMKVHSPDNPHVCPLCNKAWVNDYQLTLHLISHTGEKLFKCSAVGCGKEFTRRHNLESHMLIHTGEKTEPNTTCAMCDKSHTSHTISGLANHLKIHTGENIFKCTTCSQAFATKRVLQNHSELHMGKTPYKCDEGWKGFRWHSSLDRRMTAAHFGEQQKEVSTTAHADSIVPVYPMTGIPTKNTNKNDPFAEVVESCIQLYLDKGFHLRQLTVPVQRMKLKNVGGGVLELRSGEECWYVCSKCGRGSKSVLIRSHPLGCDVHQSNMPIDEVQTVL